jgi:hypothetical protein
MKQKVKNERFVKLSSQNCCLSGLKTFDEMKSINSNTLQSILSKISSAKFQCLDYVCKIIKSMFGSILKNSPNFDKM